MIVRETSKSFVLINQHDHAQVAGLLAQHWNPEYFIGKEKMPEVIRAVYEHDQGWMPLDQNLLWNDLAQKPYSFVDFPLAPKLEHYMAGIDAVENIDSYAALLCSLHYATFPDLAHTAPGKVFIAHETRRQHKLKEKLNLCSPTQEQQLHSHLQLLKFCDGLSIYLCINEPGVTKKKEHPWYRNGIPFSDFSFTNGKNINALWLNKNQVQVHVFPFADEFEVTCQYREVFKESVKSQSWSKAFLDTPYQSYKIRIIP